MLAYYLLKELADCWRKLGLTPREGAPDLATLSLTDVTLRNQVASAQGPTPCESVQRLPMAACVAIPPMLPRRGTKACTADELVEGR